jgi:hypothetical protein
MKIGKTSISAVCASSSKAKSPASARKSVTVANIPLADNEPLETLLTTRREAALKDGHDDVELVQRCLATAMSVIFLATGHDKLIEPHVLGKDLQAYIDACRRPSAAAATQVNAMIERARRRTGSIVSKSAATRLGGSSAAWAAQTAIQPAGISASAINAEHTSASRNPARSSSSRQHTVRPDLIKAQ